MPYCKCRYNRNPEDLRDFTQFLHNVCMRPALYMGRASLARMEAFLTGFSFGFEYGKYDHLAAIGGWPVMSDFMFYFIRAKFGVDHPAWGFARTLLHFHNHDEMEAIRAIPALFEEYLANPEVALEWKDERLDGATPTPPMAPVCDQCTMHPA